MISPRKVAALVVCAGMAATSAPAQKHPGVVTKPSGKTLAQPGPTPGGKSAELTREKLLLDAPIEATPEEQPYLEAASNGQAWAQTRLGVLYARAANDPARWKQAIVLLNKAGEQKDAEALYELATMATRGRGMPESPFAAFDYCWRAAELGSTEAQYELASMYFEGRGTTKDPDAALKWGRKAADQGNTKAMFSVGRVLIESADPTEHAEGLERINRAVQSNHAKAILFLATALARGDFELPKNEARAEALLKPAAEGGDTECQFALASLYRFGETFANQRDLAGEWLQRAADGGHLQAAEVLRGGAPAVPAAE